VKSYDVVATRSVGEYYSIPKVSLETANYDGTNITDSLERYGSTYYVSGDNKHEDGNYKLKPLNRPLVNKTVYDETNKIINAFKISYTQKNCFNNPNYAECYFSLSICSNDTNCACSYVYTTLSNDTDYGKQTDIGLKVEQYISDNCRLYKHSIEFSYKTNSTKTLSGSAMISYYISSSNYAYKDTDQCLITEYTTEPIYDKILLITSILAVAGILIPIGEILFKKQPEVVTEKGSSVTILGAVSPPASSSRESQQGVSVELQEMSASSSGG